MMYGKMCITVKYVFFSIQHRLSGIHCRVRCVKTMFYTKCVSLDIIFWCLWHVVCHWNDSYYIIMSALKHLQTFYYFSFIVLIHWHRYQHTKEWFIYECIYDKWITNHSQLFNGSKMDIWKLETVPRFRSNISRQIINMY